MARGRREIVEVRGRGLLIGIEFRSADQARRVVEAALECSLILLAGGSRGHVVTISPPLTLSTAELDLGLERIEQALNQALERRARAPSRGRRNPK
jgi:4-aminobutyrate aminotransferase-like enzyme